MEITQKKFTRTTKKEKTSKVVTKRKVQGQEGWKVDDDKLLIGVEVSKNQVSEYEDSIRMKSHVKTSSNMCIGAAYTSRKILLCFLLLSLFVLQVYPIVVQISSMVELTRLCQSPIMVGLCYVLFFIIIWSLNPKHMKKKQRCRRKVQVIHFQKVYANIDNPCGQQDSSMEKHGKEENIVTRHSRRQESMEYVGTKYKGTRGMKGNEAPVEQVCFAEHSKRTWNIFKVEYGAGAPR